MKLSQIPLLFDFSERKLVSDKYDIQQMTVESVDAIVSTGPDYVPMQKPRRKLKKGKEPTTDRAQNSLINTLWFYGNADAS
jgi:hypothetical protein